MADQFIGASKVERDLELVIKTGLLLAQERDLRVLVQAATDAGLELCGAQFGAFFYNVLNAAGESYLLYTLSGAEPDKFSGFPMPRITALFAPTFEGKGIVRSGDITKDHRYGRNAPHHGMPMGHLPVRSYLAVPIVGQTGEVFGGLFYGHEKTDVFRQIAEDRVATIAAQAAVAIENFRLREELTRQIDQQRDVAKHLSSLAAIVEGSDDAIIGKDLDGRITSWNRAAARIFGYSEGEIVGQSILTLIPEELHSEEPGIISKICAGERIEHFETVRIRKNGQRFDVSLTISPIQDSNGTIVGASKILRDISSRKLIEASLLQSEKIAAAGKMAATIAHEVNNPLEALTNLIYLASNAETLDQIRSYLKTADSELVRVSHIAKQTLGFYRENKSPVNVCLSDIAADALQVYEPKCAQANISIVRHLRSKSSIVARKGEMIQVVSNLIANAIYAMPSGGELSISTDDVCQDGRGSVVMVVEDTGVGIHAEHLPKIFEAFFSTRTAIGTGIGLFVAKQFVESHGGTIDVISCTEPDNHGTRMSISIPI